MEGSFLLAGGQYLVRYQTSPGMSPAAAETTITSIFDTRTGDAISSTIEILRGLGIIATFHPTNSSSGGPGGSPHASSGLGLMGGGSAPPPLQTGYPGPGAGGPPGLLHTPPHQQQQQQQQQQGQGWAGAGPQGPGQQQSMAMQQMQREQQKAAMAAHLLGPVVGSAATSGGSMDMPPPPQQQQQQQQQMYQQGQQQQQGGGMVVALQQYPPQGPHNGGQQQHGAGGYPPPPPQGLVTSSQASSPASAFSSSSTGYGSSGGGSSGGLNSSASSGSLGYGSGGSSGSGTSYPSQQQQPGLNNALAMSPRRSPYGGGGSQGLSPLGGPGIPVPCPPGPRPAGKITPGVLILTLRETVSSQSSRGPTPSSTALVDWLFPSAAKAYSASITAPLVSALLPPYHGPTPGVVGTGPQMGPGSGPGSMVSPYTPSTSSNDTGHGSITTSSGNGTSSGITQGAVAGSEDGPSPAPDPAPASPHGHADASVVAERMAAAGGAGGASSSTGGMSGMGSMGMGGPTGGLDEGFEQQQQALLASLPVNSPNPEELARARELTMPLFSITSLYGWVRGIALFYQDSTPSQPFAHGAAGSAYGSSPRSTPPPPFAAPGHEGEYGEGSSPDIPSKTHDRHGAGNPPLSPSHRPGQVLVVFASEAQSRRAASALNGLDLDCGYSLHACCGKATTRLLTMVFEASSMPFFHPSLPQAHPLAIYNRQLMQQQGPGGRPLGLDVGSRHSSAASAFSGDADGPAPSSPYSQEGGSPAHGQGYTSPHGQYPRGPQESDGATAAGDEELQLQLDDEEEERGVPIWDGATALLPYNSPFVNQSAPSPPHSHSPYSHDHYSGGSGGGHPFERERESRRGGIILSATSNPDNTPLAPALRGLVPFVVAGFDSRSSSQREFHCQGACGFRTRKGGRHVCLPKHPCIPAQVLHVANLPDPSLAYRLATGQPSAAIRRPTTAILTEQEKAHLEYLRDLLIAKFSRFGNGGQGGSGGVGGVQNISFAHPPRQCYVVMSSVGEAVVALMMCHLTELGGRKVRVSFTTNTVAITSHQATLHAVAANAASGGSFATERDRYGERDRFTDRDRAFERERTSASSASSTSGYSERDSRGGDRFDRRDDRSSYGGGDRSGPYDGGAPGMGPGAGGNVGHLGRSGIQITARDRERWYDRYDPRDSYGRGGTGGDDGSAGSGSRYYYGQQTHMTSSTSPRAGGAPMGGGGSPVASAGGGGNYYGQQQQQPPHQQHGGAFGTFGSAGGGRSPMGSVVGGGGMGGGGGPMMINGPGPGGISPRSMTAPPVVGSSINPSMMAMGQQQQAPPPSMMQGGMGMGMGQPPHQHHQQQQGGGLMMHGQGQLPHMQGPMQGQLPYRYPPQGGPDPSSGGPGGPGGPTGGGGYPYL